MSLLKASRLQFVTFACNRTFRNFKFLKVSHGLYDAWGLIIMRIAGLFKLYSVPCMFGSQLTIAGAMSESCNISPMQFASQCSSKTRDSTWYPSTSYQPSAVVSEIWKAFANTLRNSSGACPHSKSVPLTLSASNTSFTLICLTPSFKYSRRDDMASPSRVNSELTARSPDLVIPNNGYGTMSLISMAWFGV